MKEVCILGCGISGSMLAHNLSKHPEFNVTIFEVGRGSGGRMATRRINDPSNESIHELNIGTFQFKLQDRELISNLEEQGLIQRNVKVQNLSTQNSEAREQFSHRSLKSNGLVHEFIDTPQQQGGGFLCFCAPSPNLQIHFHTLVTNITQEQKNSKISVHTSTGQIHKFDIVVNTSALNVTPLQQKIFSFPSPLTQFASTRPDVKTQLDKINGNLNLLPKSVFQVNFKNLEKYFNKLTHNYQELTDENDFLLNEKDKPLNESHTTYIYVYKERQSIMCYNSTTLTQKQDGIQSKFSMEYKHAKTKKAQAAQSQLKSEIFANIYNFFLKTGIKEVVGDMDSADFIANQEHMTEFHRWSHCISEVKEDLFQKRWVKFDGCELYLIGDYIHKVNPEQSAENAMLSSLQLYKELIK